MVNQHEVLRVQTVAFFLKDFPFDGKVLFEYVEPEGVTGPKKLGKGLLAFQQHDPGSKVRYRNVMVKPLP